MTQRAESIVPMGEKHVPQMARIEALCFSQPWSEQSLRDELHAPLAHVLVCERDGAVLGYVGMRLVLDEGYITNIAVHPRFRRAGIGRALLGELRRYAERRGLDILTLEVRESNAGAQALYRACGFAPAGRRRRYYEEPVEDAILMTLKLSEKKEDNYADTRDRELL